MKKRKKPLYLREKKGTEMDKKRVADEVTEGQKALAEIQRIATSIEGDLKRTQMDVTSMTGALVVFGETEYEIHQRRFKASREWASKWLPTVIDAILPMMKTTLLSSTTEDYKEQSSKLFTGFGMTIFEALKDYDPTLPWDFIEEEAYASQIDFAYCEVLRMVFPFGPTLMRSVTLTQGR